MELDDAKRLWERYDAGLEGAIDAALARRAAIENAGSAAKRLSATLVFEIVLGGLLVVLVGAFIGDHARAMKFLVPALMLDAYAIAALAAAVRGLVAASNVRFGEPVVAVQRKLAALRLWRLRTVRWTLLVAPLMWVPLSIVALRGLFGIDAYATLGVRYLVANAAYGVAVLAVGLFAARRYARSGGEASALQSIASALAGPALRDAKRASKKFGFERSEGSK